MSKGPWEERVGWLLKRQDFVYAYKPVDSAMFGGATRIDWLACQADGTFWLVEVKQLPASGRTFNLENPDFISAGQIFALDAVAHASASVALLVVGQTIGNEKRLYVYDWRRLRWEHLCQRDRAQVNSGRFSLQSADFDLTFKTRSQWVQLPLTAEVFIARVSNETAAAKLSQRWALTNQLAGLTPQLLPVSRYVKPNTAPIRKRRLLALSDQVK